MLPHRADHIGSLLRPKKLREAFRAHSEKKLGDAELRAAQDEAIRDVVRLQEDCGLQVVTDGEFRRISYWEKFVRLTAGPWKCAARCSNSTISRDTRAISPRLTRAPKSRAARRSRSMNSAS